MHTLFGWAGRLSAGQDRRAAAHLFKHLKAGGTLWEAGAGWQGIWGQAEG